MTFFTLLQNRGSTPPPPQPTPISGGGGGFAGKVFPISDILPAKRKISYEVYLPIHRLFIRPTRQEIWTSRNIELNFVPIQIRVSQVASKAVVQYNEARAREDEEIAAIMAIMED